MTLQMVVTHIGFVAAAVLLTVTLGVPLGVAAYFYPAARKLILWSAEVMQTVPTLALLGIIMVFFGPGRATVVAGLLLYSLLPVVRNTYVGLSEVDPGIKEVAQGMGMTRIYRLLHIEIPIAWPLIFTGIRIAAVTSVGTAAFATFVGGGGLGTAIRQGIRISDMRLIMAGTLTLMAIAVSLDAIMAGIEKNKFMQRRK